ncbi:hypothetical protein P8452_65013 [Trifolium repens]|nr:hypothetical protein P8452_65013 [Trifolium repens]
MMLIMTLDIGVDSVYAELSNSDAVVVDRSVSINSITSNEFRAMKFESVNEAYDFYYRYGKYKGFAIRKSEVRRRGSKGSEIIVTSRFPVRCTGFAEYHIYLT